MKVEDLNFEKVVKEIETRYVYKSHIEYNLRADHKAYPAAPDETLEDITIDAFINGLHKIDIKQAL